MNISIKTLIASFERRRLQQFIQNEPKDGQSNRAEEDPDSQPGQLPEDFLPAMAAVFCFIRDHPHPLPAFVTHDCGSVFRRGAATPAPAVYSRAASGHKAAR